MAGVTFLAFGNGSPDVFSTFAAMSTHSGSMAIGELIGAAGFITAVVAGSMALVREFKVGKKSFVRDVGFFIVASSFSMVFLADGHLHLWECIVMIAFYIFYVLVVVGWHWQQQRAKRRRDRIALSRSHFQGAGFTDVEERVEESEDEDGTAGGEQRSMVEDFAALERGLSQQEEDEESDGEGERGRLLATEVSNSMRVLRPRGSRRSTMTPIRPSLVGAMEFRSVLASLQKARGSEAHHIHLRRYSDDRRRTMVRSYDDLEPMSTVPSEYGGSVIVTSATDGPGDGQEGDQSGRIRSASMNDAARHADHRDPAAFTVAEDSALGLVGTKPDIPTTHLEVPSDEGAKSSQNLTVPEQAPPSPTISITPPASVRTDSRPPTRDNQSRGQAANYEHGLAPPQAGYPGAKHLRGPSGDFFTQSSHDSSPNVSPKALRPRVIIPQSPKLRGRATPPSAVSAAPSSGPNSPFPAYFDSPLPVTPRPVSVSPSRSSHGQAFALPDAMMDGSQPFYVQDCIDADCQSPVSKPVAWWPYKYLPPPEVMRAALFPTFESWAQKGWWDRVLSVISAPSIFLLAVTLPVVESEQKEDDAELEFDSARKGRSRSGTSVTFADVPYADHPNGQVDGDAADEIEPEWLAYRRNSVATSALLGTSASRSRPPIGREHSHASTAISRRHHSKPGTGTAELAVEAEAEHRERYHDDPAEDDITANNTNANKTSKGKLSTSGTTLGNSTNLTPPSTTDLPKPINANGNINPAQGYTSPTSPTSPKPEEWNRWLLILQIFTAPLFCSLILWGNMYEDLPVRPLLKFLAIGLSFSLLCFGVIISTTSHDRIPRYRPAFCFLGFIVSIAWISTIANEVVGVLKAFGVILGISDAILGLTIFAVGNSLGDLVADITVARLGMPVMALSACFGGPLLNILLGVGISGVYMCITDPSNGAEHLSGEVGGWDRSFDITIAPTLLISAIALLVTLVSLLVVVPFNGWYMSRRIGWGLIGLWTVATIVNLVVEITGVWGEDIHRHK